MILAASLRRSRVARCGEPDGPCHTFKLPRVAGRLGQARRRPRASESDSRLWLSPRLPGGPARVARAASASAGRWHDGATLRPLGTGGGPGGPGGHGVKPEPKVPIRRRPALRGRRTGSPIQVERRALSRWRSPGRPGPPCPRRLRGGPSLRPSHWQLEMPCATSSSTGRLNSSGDTAG